MGTRQGYPEGWSPTVPLPAVLGPGDEIVTLSQVLSLETPLWAQTPWWGHRHPLSFELDQEMWVQSLAGESLISQGCVAALVTQETATAVTTSWPLPVPASLWIFRSSPSLPSCKRDLKPREE